MADDADPSNRTSAKSYVIDALRLLAAVSDDDLAKSIEEMTSEIDEKTRELAFLSSQRAILWQESRRRGTMAASQEFGTKVTAGIRARQGAGHHHGRPYTWSDDQIKAVKVRIDHGESSEVAIASIGISKQGYYKRLRKMEGRNGVNNRPAKVIANG